MSHTKLAFVLPWYGKGVSGGAETEARNTIFQLAKAGYTVEVFTTCIVDFFADWSTNGRKAGTFIEEEITVHRYPVLPRDKARFDEINQKTIGRMSVTPAEAVEFADQFINCPSLLEAIHARQNDHLFFFIPYLFPTTFDGLPVVGRNSVLIPCLHDEGYAYLELFKQVFPKAAAIVYQTESEQRLANSLYDLPSDQIQTVIGTGVDTDQSGDGDAFKRKFSIDGPYLLYAGRKDAGKNIGQMLNYWRQYQLLRGVTDRAKLILIGSGHVQIPPDLTDSVFDLGFVSAEDKRNAFAGCTALCNPSLKESFSFVLMDAWLAQKPVLVHGLSDVLVEHVRRSNGGLYYGNVEEFGRMFGWILDHGEESAVMGANGRSYVEAHYAWPTVIEKYVELIGVIGKEISDKTPGVSQTPGV